ncbi:MAG: hypothetical protein V4501_13010 [Pseudomonadota bacterium]
MRKIVVVTISAGLSILLTACQSGINNDNHPTAKQYSTEAPTTVEVPQTQQPAGPPASNMSSTGARYVY